MHTHLQVLSLLSFTTNCHIIMQYFFLCLIFFLVLSLLSLIFILLSSFLLIHAFFYVFSIILKNYICIFIFKGNFYIENMWLDLSFLYNLLLSTTVFRPLIFTVILIWLNLDLSFYYWFYVCHFWVLLLCSFPALLLISWIYNLWDFCQLLF